MNILIIVAFMAVLAGLSYLSLGIGAATLGYFTLVKAKGGTAPSPYPQPPQPPSSGWAFQYSYNMTPGQTPEDFDFPTQNGVHYCVERAPALTQGKTVTMTFSITGSGTLVPVQGSKPYVTLYIQRAGDNMSGAGQYEYYRGWGGSTAIGPGDFRISVPLTPDQWGDVMGKNFSTAPDMFAQLLANAQSIGFTFGDPSAGATGHGVYVKDGASHFTLTGYTVA